METRSSTEYLVTSETEQNRTCCFRDDDQLAQGCRDASGINRSSELFSCCRGKSSTESLGVHNLGNQVIYNLGLPGKYNLGHLGIYNLGLPGI